MQCLSITLPTHACVLSRSSHVWLSATLWTVAHQSPLSMGFSKQEYWRGLPFPPPGNLPYPGIELASPALTGEFFHHWATWEAFGVAYLIVNESLSPAQDAMPYRNSQEPMAVLPELLMISHLPLLKAVYAFVIMPAVCVNYKIRIIIAHNTTAQSCCEERQGLAQHLTQSNHQ